MFKSLTTKITVTMIVMITVCTAVFTFISYYELRNSVEAQMKNDGRTLITTIRREIGKYKISNLNEIGSISGKLRRKAEAISFTYLFRTAAPKYWFRTAARRRLMQLQPEIR